MYTESLPLLPLLLDRVPPALGAALTQEGVPWQAYEVRPSGGRFVLVDLRANGQPELLPGQQAVDVDFLRRDARGNLLELFNDTRSGRFSWQVGPFESREDVALVDRRAIRRRMMIGLAARIEQLGGIWLRWGSAPAPYRSAFCFRIDYDEYHPSDFAALTDALADWPDATSHFVCGSSYDGQRSALARLAGLDVGGHGYRHHTYRTYEENLRNLARGMDVLSAAGFEPRGFVAPHGRFNRGLQRALHALDLAYSSEFGYAFDDLPFYPAQSSVPQLPVHPVSLGSVLEHVQQLAPDRCPENPIETAVAAVTEHFWQVTQARHSLAEPIMLYGHPTARLGRYPQLLHTLLDRVSTLDGLWRTTYTRIADWWRVRSQLAAELHQYGDEYELRLLGASPYPLTAEIQLRGRMARLPLTGASVRFCCDSLSPEPVPVVRLPKRRAVRERSGWCDRLRREIDWERVTPAAELRDRSWRGLTKRVLRTLKPEWRGA